MNPLERLWNTGISRRDFMKYCSATAAALGLASTEGTKLAEAVESAAAKPPVIWLHGQECTGCTESLAATISPSVAEVVLDTISLRYHETLMAGQGHVSEEALAEAIKEGGYVLVVEGSIPTGDPRFCEVGGKAFEEIVKEAAANAKAIIAFGSCATHGGINVACPTKSVGVMDIIKDKPIINLTGCPGRPNHLIATILYFLTYGVVPECDDFLRPKVFFGKVLHDNCPRRGHFENGEFLEDWNDPKQKDWCLILKGCKGPKTYTDCAQVLWNDNTNFCLNAGSPCSGCTEKDFYGGFSPLYTKQDIFEMPGLGEVNVDTVGKVIGAAAVVGAAAHIVGNVAVGPKKGHAEGKGGSK